MQPIVIVALIGSLAAHSMLAGEAKSEPNRLFHPIRAGDLPAVQSLMKQGADVQAGDDHGNTPLMAAAMNADAAIVQLLLDAGADVNATNKAGATALMRAATFEDKARLLIAKGADVNARSELGNSPLILAARKPGNSGTVKLLLDRGAAVNATNVFGSTPLMAATAALDLDSVRLLLDRGADINARPNMNGDGFIWGGGRTPLMWAAFLGNEELIKLLLSRGARVDHFTLAGGALEQAAWGGHPGAARLLLDAGAPVDQRDFVANYTPLHWAASSERSSPVLTELLLGRGADANAEGGQPVDNFLGATQTPLSLARKRGDTPIVQALLRGGARVAAGSAPSTRKKSAQSGIGTSGSLTVADAIQRALAPLTKTAEDSASTFLRHASRQDCISCHQQQLPLAAISLAKSRHFATDQAATSHQLSLLYRMVSSKVSAELPVAVEVEQAAFHPEPAIFDGYVSMALHLQREPGSTMTDGMVHHLATIQHRDGHWSWNLPRPPIQASDFGATALAVHTLKFYGIPARRKELESRLQRARVWLANAMAESNEERIHQLLGLAWAGEDPGTLKKFAKALIREQRADGGWGQLAGLDSDAFATGQSLYALMEGGRISDRDPAVRRGIDFLLRTQLSDGTWHVRRRTHPFQPPMDSGFPHGADGWISCAGTSWAVMALATSLDLQKTPEPSAGAISIAGVSKPAATARTDAVASPMTGPVEFTRDVQPLLERSCVACHSGERAKGGFRVTHRAALLQGGKRGEPAVVPGKPDVSPLIRFVQDQVEDLEMPPLSKRAKFPALTKEEIGKLSGWIAQGANWPQGATLHAPER